MKGYHTFNKQGGGHYFLHTVYVPAYSEKHIVSGDLKIFSSKRSFLLRKRIMDVSPNHLLLQIESNSFRLSCIRFYKYIKISSKKILLTPFTIHKNMFLHLFYV